MAEVRFAPRQVTAIRVVGAHLDEGVRAVFIDIRGGHPHESCGFGHVKVVGPSEPAIRSSKVDWNTLPFAVLKNYLS